MLSLAKLNLVNSLVGDDVYMCACYVVLNSDCYIIYKTSSNSPGPSTEPCGTPEIISIKSDSLPFISNYFFECEFF